MIDWTAYAKEVAWNLYAVAFGFLAGYNFRKYFEKKEVGK